MQCCPLVECCPENFLQQCLHNLHKVVLCGHWLRLVKNKNQQVVKLQVATKKYNSNMQKAAAKNCSMFYFSIWIIPLPKILLIWISLEILWHLNCFQQNLPSLSPVHCLLANQDWLQKTIWAIVMFVSRIFFSFYGRL